MRQTTGAAVTSSVFATVSAAAAAAAIDAPVRAAPFTRRDVSAYLSIFPLAFLWPVKWPVVVAPDVVH